MDESRTADTSAQRRDPKLRAGKRPCTHSRSTRGTNPGQQQLPADHPWDPQSVAANYSFIKGNGLVDENADDL
jgi:hypothetical protein